MRDANHKPEALDGVDGARSVVAEVSANASVLRWLPSVASRRKLSSGIASVSLHLGLFALVRGLLGEPSHVPTPRPEVPLIEIVPLAIPPADDVQEQDAFDDGASPAPLAASSLAAAERHGDRTVSETAREASPRPTSPRVPELEALEPVLAAGTIDLPNDLASTPTQSAMLLGEDPPTAGAPTRSGDGRGLGNGGQGRGHNHDFSAYGAELVRIVTAEIDAHPVPGIDRGESIHVVLEVLPNGRLAVRGPRKADSVRVLESSLGRLPQWGIIQRVLRASLRFPPHPRGFPRRTYVLAVELQFRGNVVVRWD